MRRRSAAGLLFAAGGSTAGAGLGGAGSPRAPGGERRPRRAPEVSARLDKPHWAPPAEVFGPVWTGLYGAIAVAGWRLWERRTAPSATTALGLHVGQLALNAAWPWTFFSVRNRTASLAVIVALDALVAAEIVTAARVDRTAAALLAPYLGWSLFATALTAAVSDPA